jgi:peroxiredoxin
VTQLRPYYEAIKALNTEVFLISFETGYWLQVWLAETEVPFPLLLDPTRRAYQAYGLERSRLRSWGPKNLWYYTRARLSGRQLHKTGGDTAQLGGDFIVDTEGIVRLAHPSREPTDRPQIAELLIVLAQLSGR